MNNIKITPDGYLDFDYPQITDDTPPELIAPYIAADGTKPGDPRGGGMRLARWMGTWDAVNKKWLNESWVDEEAAEHEAAYSAQQLTSMEQRLEKYTEEVARQKRYRLDTIHIWLNSSDTAIAAEAQAFIAWYESFWLAAAQVEADVVAGNRTAPTYEELVAELPLMSWPA